MEKFTFIDRKISNRKINAIAEAFISLCMATAFVMCVCDICTVTWSFSGAFSGTPGGGLVHCCNAFARNLAASDSVMLQKLAGESEECGLFLTMLGTAAFIISFFTLKSGKKLWLAVAPIVIIVTATVFNLRIDFGSVVFMSAATTAAYVYMDGGLRNAVMGIIFATIVMAVTVGVFRIPAVADFIENPTFINNIREKTADFATDMYYGDNPLQSGDLTQRVRSESDETALQISMEDPHSMYLRGFVGERYNGKEWEALPSITFYDFSDKAYWLERSGFNIEGQSGQVKDLLLDKMPKHGEVTIKTVNADKRYGYIPYEISSVIEDAQQMGGSFVIPKKFTRLKNYSYTAADNPAKDWTETASKLFTGESTEAIEKYLLAESYYNTHIYESYTYLSNKERDLLTKHFGPSKSALDAHADYKIAINDIKKYLDENFIYTEDLGEASDSKSFLETFLVEKKGFDVHYASAAALMFRYYGIPARYVEGYLLTPEDAEKMKSGKAYDLPKERNHAWTEIYIDGLGFIPIEVCPEYAEVMEEADLSVGISNDSLKPSFDEIGASQNSTVDAGGADKSHERIDIFLLIMILMALIVAVAILYVMCKKIGAAIRTRHRNRYICYKSDPKTAVSAILGFMEDEELPIDAATRNLGNKAAYSMEIIDEDMRKQMLECLKTARKEKREIEKSERKKKRADRRNADAASCGFTALFMRSGKSGRKS